MSFIRLTSIVARRLVLFISTCLLFLIPYDVLLADDYYFTDSDGTNLWLDAGSVSVGTLGNWEDYTTLTNNMLPGASDNAIFYSSGTVSTGGSSIPVGTLTIDEGVDQIFNGGGQVSTANFDDNGTAEFDSTKLVVTSSDTSIADLNLSNGTSVSFSGTLEASQLSVTQNSAITVTGLLSGTRLIASGSSTINAGGVSLPLGSVSSVSDSSSLVAGSLAMPSAFLQINGGSSLTVTGKIDISGGGQLSIGASNTGSEAGGNVTTASVILETANDSISFDQTDATATYSFPISGAGNVLVASTGVTTLTGVNAYTGATTISSGTLAIGPGGTIINSGGVSLTSSGTAFDISKGGNQTIKELTGVAGSTINLGANTLTVGEPLSLFQAAPSTTFGGVITGTGGLTTGPGALYLLGANTYTGGTSIAPNSILIIGNGGTAASIAGNVVDNGTLEFNPGTGYSFGGQISGGGGVTQTGARAGGTLTLNANNTYTGATLVQYGTLIVSGSTASGSAVTINNGGILGGATGSIEGTLNGTVTVAGGGAINLADTAIGTLKTGSLTIGQAGTPSALTFEITAGALGNLDSIVVAGSLTMVGVNGTTITIANIGTPTLTPGTYNLITYSGTEVGDLTNLSLTTTSLDGETLSLVQETGAIQLQVGGSLTAQMILHRATSVTNGSSDFNVDEPLIPTPDSTSLPAQPKVAKGLVADGVTPLILELDVSDGSTTPTNYTLSVDSITGGTFSPNALAAQLQVLSQGGWTMGNISYGTTVTIPISPTQPGFAYIQGFKPELFTFTNGATQLAVQLSIQKSDGSGSKFSLPVFYIRKPPVVLVHGYNVDPASTPSFNGQPSYGWPSSFLQTLNQTYPADFIKPITYDDGVKSINTEYPLIILAQYLDEDLSSGPEFQGTGGSFAGWAFTRYDLICHSQGGVLARMLCTVHSAYPNAQLTPFGTVPFRSPDNFYRGRFRRIVTMGSPHNGSRFVHYLSSLRHSNNDWFATLPIFLQTTLQGKFDPFSDQIQGINDSHLKVDPAAKFHLVSTQIAGGQAPGVSIPSAYPPVYLVTGMCSNVPGQNYTRGQVVVGGTGGSSKPPNTNAGGSDGVVDLTSAQGGLGNGNIGATYTSQDVAHSDVSVTILDLYMATIPTYLFGVTSGQSDTSFPAVATTDADLLSAADGTNQFGSFNLPALLTTKDLDGVNSEEAAIDAVTPHTSTFGIIVSGSNAGASVHLATVVPEETTTTYSDSLSPDPSEPLQGTVTWYAEVYAPGGVTSNGVTLTVNSSDSTQVSVAVDSSMVGDVVLKASYTSTTGDLVSPPPIVVVSIAPTAAQTGISLSPSPAYVIEGDTSSLELDETYSDGTSQPAFISASNQAQYHSSSTAVLTVDSYGTMQGVAPGQATVTVSYGGYSAQTTVTVGAPGLGPQIISAGTATGNVNSSFSYQIVATNTPTSFGATVEGTTLSTIGLSINPTTGLISGTPTIAGTYTITTTASNATLYSGSNTLTVTIRSPGTNFVPWEGQPGFFTPQELSNSAVSGLTATPQNDGVANLLKYVYDINPSRPMTTTDRSALPVTGMTTIGQTTYLTLTFQEYQSLTGVTVNVETSTDLVNWSTPLNASINQIGMVSSGDLIMQAQVPITTSKQFIRLQVTTP